MQSETSKTKKQNIDFEVANFALLPIKELENNDIEPTFSNEAILSKEEKWGIFLLHLLYFVQGIPFGFFGLAIPYLLIEKGADFTQIGILSFCLYPFCFKIFLAPFEDIYFFRNFGKRKTYIIPCQYLLAFFFLILSFIINGLLEDLNVGVLCFLGFLIVLIIAFQDVSVDGWVLTLLSNENVKWGAVSQCVGQAIGIIFGGSILIQLSSVKFCNEYLFSEPSNSPLITIPNFLRIFAIIILLINFWVHFGIKERNPAKNEYLSVWILVKDLKGFYTNANLRYCVILCLTSNLGFAAVTNTAPLKLIQLGFSKETLTTISMTLILVNLGLSFIIGKYARIGNEMSLYIRFYVILFVHNIFLFILISVYDGTQGGSFTFLYVISALFGDGTAALVMVNQGSFNNRISDEDVGGTFLTFLNAMWNFGRFGGTSLILFLVDSFNYTVLVILSWVYVIVYMAVFGKTFLKLERVKKKTGNFEFIYELTHFLIYS